MGILAGLGDQKFTSLGLSGRAHVLAFVITLGGAWFVLRLLRRRQMRGKYTLLWMLVLLALLVIAAFPTLVDHTSRWLHIYYAPSTLFLAAIGFLLMVCVYFSYELSRLEERTRLLAEELAILRGDHDDSEPRTVG